MVISNYSMPDSSKLSKTTSNTSSRQTTKRVEKPKKEEPKKEEKKEEVDENGNHIITEKEFQEKEYQKMVKEQKLKEVLEEKKYKDIAVRIAPEENIFCLAVDGSQTSKDAFEIILSEFLPRIHDSVLICPHIYS